jgi:hypothetical protein
MLVCLLNGGTVDVRKLLYFILLVGLVSAGLGAWVSNAQAADTGNPAPQTGRIVSDEPGQNAPNILDGSVLSIAKVGNTIVVGGEFTRAQNHNTSATVTRNNLLAFDATTGKLTSLAPNPAGKVWKVLPAGDGKSVYVAGEFTSAAGKAVPGRVFKVDVTTGVVNTTFVAPKINGKIRDLELVGNHLFIAGKFGQIGGVDQRALGTLYADTGKRDPYVDNVFAGVRNSLQGAVTDVLQISVNPQNTELMAVGNFTSVDGQTRWQIARLDIGNIPSGTSSTVHSSLSPWSTNLYTSACAARFDTYMTDVEYSRDGSYFIVSTTGAYGGAAASNAGTSGCDVVTRFEDDAKPTSTPTWTAYTGSDTTWTVEVTDRVVYAGGHQKYQNNPGGNNVAGPGAVARTGIAALNPVNGMPYSWNPTRTRGVGVQDILATADGLYVGSDTERIGHTPGNTYHPRIAFLPLAGGKTLPPLHATSLPVEVYRVASGASQLTSRTFDGSTAGTAGNAPNGPGWGASTGAFMVNGVLYKVSSDGSVAKMSFDGTTYGSSSPVNTADQLVFQGEWHADAKTLTSIFYANGRIYYTKSGTNALYRRGFEVEDDVVGQQRFSTTTSGINWSSVRGAFVVGNKLYYADTSGALFSATWNQTANAPVAGTVSQLTSAGAGWASRAMFFSQATDDPGVEPPGPASFRHRDARHDAQRFDPATGHVSRADGNKAADIVRSRLRYSHDHLASRIRVRSGSIADRWIAGGRLHVAGGDDYSWFGGNPDGSGVTFTLHDSNGDAVACDIGHDVARRKGRLTVTVPASCFGDPLWVEAGISYGVQKKAHQVADDGLRKRGLHTNAELTLSPKLHHG